MKKLRRVAGSLFHWSYGSGHFGLFTAGRCWPFRFTKTPYFGGHTTWRQFWRFFWAHDHRKQQRADDRAERKI